MSGLPHEGQVSGDDGKGIPFGCGSSRFGGGRTTLAAPPPDLFANSLEYHHSRNFKKNILMGRSIFKNSKDFENPPRIRAKSATTRVFFEGSDETSCPTCFS